MLRKKFCSVCGVLWEKGIQVLMIEIHIASATSSSPGTEHRSIWLWFLVETQQWVYFTQQTKSPCRSEKAAIRWYCRQITPVWHALPLYMILGWAFPSGCRQERERDTAVSAKFPSITYTWWESKFWGDRPKFPLWTWKDSLIQYTCSYLSRSIYSEVCFLTEHGLELKRNILNHQHENSLLG